MFFFPLCTSGCRNRYRKRIVCHSPLVM